MNELKKLIIITEKVSQIIKKDLSEKDMVNVLTYIYEA